MTGRCGPVTDRKHGLRGAELEDPEPAHVILEQLRARELLIRIIDAL